MKSWLTYNKGQLFQNPDIESHYAAIEEKIHYPMTYAFFKISWRFLKNLVQLNKGIYPDIAGYYYYLDFPLREYFLANHHCNSDS